MVRFGLDSGEDIKLLGRIMGLGSVIYYVGLGRVGSINWYSVHKSAPKNIGYDNLYYIKCG